MRVFLGIPVPPSEAFTKVTKELDLFPGSKIVPPDSWHVTLRFLGEIDSLDEVVTAITSVLKKQRTLPAVVEGVGTFPGGFPPNAKARIAWAAVRADGLEALALSLEKATSMFGEPPEKRAFVGHVTLARFAKGSDLRSLVDRHAKTLFAQCRLNRVVLYESVMGAGPTRYREAQTWRLGEA